MAKLVFPGVGAPYRGFIGEVRGWVNRIATYHDRQSGATANLVATLRPLMTKLGVTFTSDLPATSKVVANGSTQTGVTMTGTAGAGKTATFTVAGGAITAIAFT